MPGRKAIQEITRPVYAGEPIILPDFDRWSERHADGNSEGVAKAKISLLLAFARQLSGGAGEFTVISIDYLSASL